MKQKLRKITGLCWLSLVLLILGIFAGCGKEVKAAEKKKVMTLTIQDAYKTTETGIYATDWGNGYYNFELEKDSFSILKKNAKDTLKITVSVNDPSVIVADSLKYEKEAVLTGTNSCRETISFSYREGGEIYQDTLSYWLYPYETELQIESLVISAGSKGFNPSKGNYIFIRSGVWSEGAYGNDSTVNLRIRVNNKAGKYVYQKNLKNIGSGFLNLKWNGKASKNNAAKVKAGSYIKSGTYKVELYLYYTGNGYKKSVTKTKKLVVSKKAPSGTKGLEKAKQIPMLTGNSNIDYMAEQMIKSAGVRSSMSQDQKVKKIYHYMTTHFKHKHYYESPNKYKVYYNTSKLSRKIASYKKTTDKNLKNGKLIYNYQAYYNAEWCMARRIGVCSDHAAIFQILCNHVGIEAGICNGYYKNRNGSLAGHSWNYAVVNGRTYYYDVDIEIQNYKKGQGDYYWYKKTKSQAKKNHKFY